MSDSSFTHPHPWDRWLPIAFLAAAWASIYFGFNSSVAARFAGEADFPAPWILQLHVFVVTGWMLGLVLQVALIRKSRPELHRRVGIGMMALALLVIVTAVGAEVVSQRFYTPQFPQNVRFFIEPLVQAAVFAVCIGAGWWMRRNAAAHKRLMLLGTTALLIAAYTRWWGDGLYEVFGDGFWGMIVHNYAGPDLLMALLVGFDLATRRRIHPVYLIGVPLVLLSQLAASAIYHSNAWPAIARGWLGL
jgi:hypothetical protein